ncbi:MAG: phospholipase D-like domain-containing protein [Gemmatimonadota bacterium]
MTAVSPDSDLLEAAFERAAAARAVGGNKLTLLVDGPAAYPAMIGLIEQATERIRFENYIISSDATGVRFAEALMERARAGVQVSVLSDWLGSSATRRRYWRLLREAGVEVRHFHPPNPLRLFDNLSRDHRKLVVADGRRAVIGGLCIGDAWCGNPAEDRLPWRDTAVMVEGPAAGLLEQAFNDTWHEAGGAVVGRVDAEVFEPGASRVRVLRGLPGRERTIRVLELLATMCRERLWITDAYMLPPYRLLQALLDAAKSGVDIRLLVPGSSDLPWIRNLTRIGYRTMLRAGIRIYEWDGPMLHAKTLVADGRWCRIGSSNLNPSSLMGNYELDVMTDDRELAGALEAQFRRDLSQSREVVRVPGRGPRELAAVMPSRLLREAPELAASHHRRARGEGRRRAVLTLRSIAGGARRSIYGPLSLVLVALGILFWALPRISATVAALVCAWLAVAAFLEALDRRRA